MWPFFLGYIADFSHNARHCYYDLYNGLEGQGEGEDVITFDRPKVDCDSGWQVCEGGATIL